MHCFSPIDRRHRKQYASNSCYTESHDHAWCGVVRLWKCLLEALLSCIVQGYMAQWWAKLAAAEKEFTDGAAAVEKASKSTDGKICPSLREGGSWYLEAVQLLQDHSSDSGEKIVDRIREQLAEKTSE